MDTTTIGWIMLATVIIVGITIPLVLILRKRHSANPGPGPGPNPGPNPKPNPGPGGCLPACGPLQTCINEKCLPPLTGTASLQISVSSVNPKQYVTTAGVPFNMTTSTTSDSKWLYCFTKTDALVPGLYYNANPGSKYGATVIPWVSPPANSYYISLTNTNYGATKLDLVPTKGKFAISLAFTDASGAPVLVYASSISESSTVVFTSVSLADAMLFDIQFQS